VALTAQQLGSLFGQFQALQVQGHANPPMPMTQPEATLVAHGAHGPIIAWAYDPKVDVENDGSTQQAIVIWRGRPADAEEPAGVCGVPHDAPRESADDIGYRTAQLALVTTSDYMSLDEARTRALFGHPTGGLPVPHTGSRFPAGRYLSIGSSMSIFEYKGLFYFDTFFWGNGWADFEGKRTHSNTLLNHLAVFERKSAVTRQVCEYEYEPNHSLLPADQL
jgi:hypothetical protein